MFKKTLIAAALLTATSAVAGDVTIAGDAYKVGNEYLGAYTGTALSGDLETAAIGITYGAGIALGVDNTLKFTFTGGSIAADTGLKLYLDSDVAIQADIATDVAAVADGANVGATLTAAKAAATAVTAAAVAANNNLDETAIDAAIAAAVAGADHDETRQNVIDAAAASRITVTDPTKETVADLVDFGVDANNNYEWVLFKLTAATAVTDTLTFNDSNLDGSANVVTKFTKATIGSGDLTVAMPEAKDGTGADLAAPVASAKTLVTTANQFDVEVTKAVDTIDVEQDRKFFVNAANGHVVTADMELELNEDNTIALGIDATAADFVIEVTGSMQGVDAITYDDGAQTDLDDDNQHTDTGLVNADVRVTVDGTSNLDTRTLGVTYMVTPNEADTEAFYLVGSASASTDAFQWKLNGSEVTFPYAPIGFSHIGTNFEIANSGDQDGGILITAYDTAGTEYSATLPQVAEGGKLTAVSGWDIEQAFNISAGTKLSLKFTTSAPAGDIKVTGYSVMQEGFTGRMTLLSDAYETANCTYDGATDTVTCN